MWKCVACQEANAEPRWECRNCGRPRRREPRIRVNWVTRWGVTERCEEQARLTSLGPGGCFVQTEKGVGRGEEVFVLLELPSAEAVRGEVRYHMERVGLGVQFKGLTEENRSELRALLEDFESAVGEEA